MSSLRPIRSFSRSLGSPVFCIGWLAEGGSANSPTSRYSISSGTVTMSNWLPPSSLPLRASEPESPVGLRKSTEDAFPTSIRGSASVAARGGSLTRMTKGSPQHHRWPRILGNGREFHPVNGRNSRPGKVSRGCRPSKNGRGRRPGNGWGQHRSIIKSEDLPGYIPRRYIIPATF